VQVVILGCGTSGGVPRIGGRDGRGDWGACDPANPKNRRTRCSILVRQGSSTVLIDTSPDCREQLIGARVNRLDGVIWTHEHADQLHGVDDPRALALRQGPIEGWADERTWAILRHRFGYCFSSEEAGWYNPIYRPKTISGPSRIGEVEVTPFKQDHGTIPTLGLRFGPIAYVNDVVRLEEEAFAALAGVDTMIVDAMRYTPHPTHAHVELALSWIARVKPRRAVLTNLHVDLDYARLAAELPAGVEPAYDGMVIDA
jgi:phosphoribosyl 1,2-cyclic phosphate phosphodiesterase